jgi:hypothetical protein
MKQFAMKHWKYLVCAITVFIIAGCVPTRYSWSPDGKWMTVISDDGLRIAGADGNLLPSNIAGVQVAAWFPDSKRVIVSREVDVASWNELTKYLSPQQTVAISQAGDIARHAAMDYDWNKPVDDKWEDLLNLLIQNETAANHDVSIYHDWPAAIGVYLRDHNSDALRKKVPAEQWKELGQFNQSVFFIEICEVDPSGPKLGARLMTSLKVVRDLRVSPTGLAATVVTEGNQDHCCNLSVVAANANGKSLLLSDRAAWYPDWSPDGKQVIFAQARAGLGKDGSLGTLARTAPIIDDAGKLADKAVAPEDLAGILYSEFTRVRSLADGQIIFASVELTLPATSSDLPQHLQLFSISPGKQATVTRLLTRQALEQIGDDAQYFELSPGGNFASIPDSSGRVTLVDLRTGGVSGVQDKEMKSSKDQAALLTVPQWRNSDELTFAAPGEGNHRDVTLWSISKNSGTQLSANWPANFIDLRPTTQPADNANSSSK